MTDHKEECPYCGALFDAATAPSVEPAGRRYCRECDLRVTGPCGSSLCGVRAPSVEARADKLEALSREIVKLHKERGCVLTVHVEQMADLLAEIDALKESKR